MAVTSQCASREKRNDFEMNRSMTDANNNPRIDESFDDELGHAAKELITGDSDDPPLSEETVLKTLRITYTRTCPNGRLCELTVVSDSLHADPVAIPYPGPASENRSQE